MHFRLLKMLWIVSSVRTACGQRCPEESGSCKPQVTIFAGDFPHFVPPTAANMQKTPEEWPSADVADMEPSAPPLLEWTMIPTPAESTATTLCNVAGFGASSAKAVWCVLLCGLMRAFHAFRNSRHHKFSTRGANEVWADERQSSLQSSAIET